MAAMASRICSTAHWLDDHAGFNSRSIGCCCSCSGVGKARVSFVNKPFGASTQWSRNARQRSVRRSQWRSIQVTAMGENAEDEETAVKTAEDENEEPAATKHEELAAKKHEEPAATKHEEPAATKHEEPAATKHEEPAATKHEEPVVAKHEEPAVTKKVEQAKIEGAKVAGQTEEKKAETTAKTEEYSSTMQQAMGTSLEYRHELGINYAYVLPDLIVGSCLQTPLDADKLKKIGVGVIFCLQQNPDLAYFGVDLPAIQKRVDEIDGITHYRCQIRDFDPYDLRMRLPVAVAQLHRAIEKHKSTTAYIHCTAGLGRAPGVALAYMYWLRGLSLKEANVLLQKVRRCHPKLDSIRAATVDLLADQPKQTVELKWWAGPTTVEIAGLDVGWNNQRLPLEFRQHENQWVLRREVPVGKYEYKYIVDGVWMTNSESPLSQPNRDGQVNNVLEVVDTAQDGAIQALRDRLMKEDADLTTEERAKIRGKLEEIANSGQW